MGASESTEQQLKRIRGEIAQHRKKAATYRKRAEAQDRFADAKVKIAAEFGTGTLPLMNRTGMSDDPCALFTPMPDGSNAPA